MGFDDNRAMRRKTIFIALVIGLTLGVTMAVFKYSTMNNTDPNHSPDANTQGESTENTVSPNATPNGVLSPEQVTAISQKGKADPNQNTNLSNNQKSRSPAFENPQLQTDNTWKLSSEFQKRFGSGKVVRTEERSDPVTGNLIRSFLIETEKKYTLIEIEKTISTETGNTLLERASVADHLIVKLRKPLQSEEIQNLVHDLRLTPRGSLQEPLVILHFDRTEPRQNPNRIIRELEASGLVEYAERDYIVITK